MTAIILLVGSTVVAANPKKPAKPKKLDPQRDELKKAGTEAEVTAWIEKYPSTKKTTRVQAWAKVAQLRSKSKKPAEALTAYEKCIEVHGAEIMQPTKFRYSGFALRAAIEAKDWKKARTHLAAAETVVNNPANAASEDKRIKDLTGDWNKADLLERKASILLGERKRPEAIAALKDSLDVTKHPKAYRDHRSDHTKGLVRSMKLARLQGRAKDRDGQAKTLADSINYAKSDIGWLHDNLVRLKAIKPETDLNAMVAKIFSHRACISSRDPGVLLQLVGIPANDTIYLSTSSMQTVVRGRVSWNARQPGSIATNDSKTMIDQLTDGGTFRPFETTAEARALAALIDPYDTREAKCMSLLLRGMYPQAARLAWSYAQNEKDRFLFQRWVLTTAAAVRCIDQQYNGRDVEFVKWVNNEIATNPIADILNPGE